MELDLVTSFLGSYGILGIWTSILLIEKFKLFQAVKNSIDKNTEAVTNAMNKHTEVLGRLIDKIK